MLQKTFKHFAERRWFLRCGQLEKVFGGVWLVCVLCEFHGTFSEIPVILSHFYCVCLPVIPWAMAQLCFSMPRVLQLHLSSSLETKEVLQKQPCPTQEGVIRNPWQVKCVMT